MNAIPELLLINVPRFIEHMINRGGVSKEELLWLKLGEEGSAFTGLYNKFHLQYLEKMGMTAVEWTKLREENKPEFYAQGMIEQADSLLLHPKDEATFKASIFTLVKAIAILSFCPGGIYIFGMHFSPELKGFVESDDME